MFDGPSLQTRRGLLESIAGVVALGALGGCTAYRAPTARPMDLRGWTEEAVALKDALRNGTIDVLQWQDSIERLNRQVSASELVEWLDIDDLTRDFSYSGKLADVVDPVLPAEVIGAGGMKGWFVRVFGLAETGAIVPHVHNNMVSAHMVIEGTVRARTHDRIRDLEDAILLQPTFDGVLARGDVISMSDKRNNQHWMIAEGGRARTFDVGVVGVPASWDYGHEAGSYNMIYIDPSVAPERNGTIIAPIIDWDTAVARFAT